MFDQDNHDIIITKLIVDRDAANSHFERNLETDIEEQYEIYHAKENFYKILFPKLSKTSSLVSTDVRDTIEWALPALVKTITASDEIIKIQGTTPDDDQNAEVMQDLINFQLQRKNDWFITVYQWLKDGLITRNGIVKCYWDREEKIVKQSIALSEDALQSFAQDPNNEILDYQYDMANGEYNVIFNGPRVVKNQPVIENILASEFRYSPEATTLDDADYVAHRKIVTIDYLRRKAKDGIYVEEQVKKAIDQAKPAAYTRLEEENNEELTTQKNKLEKNRARVELYENYVKMSLRKENGQWVYDEDELLDDFIITTVDDVIIRIEKNHYGRHPFFTFSPSIDPHKVWPENGSFVDLVGPIQHVKTALLRQYITSLALANDPKIGIDISELVDINDVIEGKMIYRLKGNKPMNQVITQITQHQPSPTTLPFMQYMDEINADRTGISDYTKGQDAGNALNDTATGISIITQSANKRLELIARIFIEKGVIPLFRFLIELNQKFIDEETVIRLTNKTYTVRPDDLTGEFDLLVSANLTINHKEQQMAMAQQLKMLVADLAQVGMAGPEQFYNVAKVVVEAIGKQNVDDYCINPQILAQQQQAQMMGGPNGIPGPGTPQGGIGGAAP